MKQKYYILGSVIIRTNDYIISKGDIIMEVTINGVKKEVSKEEMKDRVIGYYDAVGIKHFYLEVDEMDDEELKALYVNSFARE